MKVLKFGGTSVQAAGAIRKDKRMNKFHFLQHVFDALENHKEAVEFISSSETGVLVLTNDFEETL